VRWNSWIRYVLVSYNQFTFACCLQLWNFDTTNALSILGHVFNSISITFAILFSLWCMWVMSLRHPRDNKKIFSEKFGSLCDDFKDDGSAVNKNFMSIILVRKLSFMVSVVLLYNYPLLNLSFLMIQNIAIICLVIITNPYQRIAFNMKNMVQEAVLLFINILLVCIYYDYLHVDHLDTVGWVMTGLCLFLIGYNFVFLVYDQYCSVKELCITLREKLKVYKAGKNQGSNAIYEGKQRKTRKKRRVSSLD